MRIFFIVLYLGVSISLSAQDDSFVKEKYVNEEKVILTHKKHIDIRSAKKGVSITEYVDKSYYYLADSNRNLGEESISYNSFGTIKEITAYTNDPTTSKKSYVRDFEDESTVINGIFYSDQKVKKFVFPNIKKGVVGNLSYSKQINDPHFISPFIPSARYSTDKAIFSVSYPENVEIKYRLFNIDTTAITFTKVVDKGTTTLTWDLKAIKKLSRSSDFSPLYYIPQIFVYIDNYRKNNKEISVLSDTKDLYGWYTDLISTINNTDQDALKQLTLELINGAQTQQEKLERVYYFVQNEINYIAFEDGLNGFVPRDALEVYTNKYGDCKDMANILNEMLRYAGVNSSLTWIGTRRKPYSYEELSTPFTDNHMITAAYVDNEYVFLDATAKYLTYGLPSPFIQGKQALIGKGKDVYELYKIPEVNASENRLSMVSDFKISDDNTSLIGSHKTIHNGYNKLEMLHKLDNKKDDDKDFLRGTLRYGYRNTIFSNITYENKKLNAAPIDVYFETVTSSIKTIGDNLYVKPLLDTYLTSDLVKDDGLLFDKKIDFKTIRDHRITIKIPVDYTVKEIPDTKVFENNLFSFSVSFKMLDEETLEVYKEVEIHTLKVEKNILSEWNQFVKQLNKANKTTIVLKKKI